MTRARPADKQLAAVIAPPGHTEMDGYTGPAGRRRFVLHVPAGRAPATRPLVVMLHGGMQTAAEFMADTAMNDVADQLGFVVAYPQQSRQANPQRFWNWFDPKHQHAGSGEPAILAGIVDQVVDEQACDPSRVFIAGFSSGGAMAAIMAACYPDVFAGLGVHSGLAYGAAGDMMSGWQAMQEGGPPPKPGSEPLPLIVFHGDRDGTVSPENAHRLIASRLGAGTGATVDSQTAPAADGQRSYTVKTYRDRTGHELAEYWTVHGGGHNWSGGSPGTSYSDPRGPSASAEMVRFFLAQAPSGK